MSTTAELDPLYDVIIVWNPYKDGRPYKDYCMESICNIMGYNKGLALKLVTEACNNTRVLINSTKNIDKATTIRDNFLALGIDCIISKSGI